MTNLWITQILLKIVEKIKKFKNSKIQEFNSNKFEYLLRVTR
jgi:hypothetical protein